MTCPASRTSPARVAYSMYYAQRLRSSLLPSYLLLHYGASSHGGLCDNEHLYNMDYLRDYNNLAVIRHDVCKHLGPLSSILRPRSFPALRAGGLADSQEEPDAQPLSVAWFLFCALPFARAWAWVRLPNRAMSSGRGMSGYYIGRMRSVPCALASLL